MDKEKKIDVGSSSLVDLKAELHRKQQESRTLRRGPDRPPSTSSKSSSKSRVWSKANAGVEKRDHRDREEVERESKDLDRSKLALEAKARVYDRLQTGTDALEDDATNERFLVNFQQKAIDDVTRRRQRRQSAEEGSSTEAPPAGPASAADEWVEFTDSLGRSRTVMRRDLTEYRRRDQESQRETDGPQPQTAELVSEDGRREQQRQLWEQQELDNAAKRDVHYQDVLFNEARAHGAGYFAFSQDAEERARQRAELDELRGRTETQQGRAELARKRKNKQLKERLRKVRERKRLRLGLPVEDRLEKEEEEEEEGQEEAAPATPAQPTPEELSRQQEEEKKEKERERFIREWDLGKEGVSKKPVLTQEQWVEQQRQDRPAEFAPPTQYETGGRGRGRGRGRTPQHGGAGGRAPRPSTAAKEPPPQQQSTERPAAGQTGPQPHTEQCAAPETGPPHPPTVAQRPAHIGRTPPNVEQMPHIGQPPSNMGQMFPNMGQPPPSMGQMVPNMGQPPPSMGQMFPNMGQPLPSMGQMPVNTGQPPPSMGQMFPNMEQPPPSMGQMPVNTGQPPPSMGQMPVNMGQPPPSMGQMPASLGQMPASLGQTAPSPWQPPPMRDQQPAGSGRLPGQAAGTGGRAGGSQSAAAGGRPGRVASYRARQAAAADLTDPDCVPPAEEGADRGAGPEVAPPVTAEYYGGDRRGRRLPAARPDVGSAIDAGLALLTQDTEQKHSKTFDL